jgi:protein SCO1/2
MACSDPRDFLLQYQTLGAFIVIALMLFLAAGQIQNHLIKRLLYSQTVIIILIYIGLITPAGASYYTKTYSQITSKTIQVTDKISIESLSYIQSTLNKKWDYLFVYFGYTFCPDVCPTTLNEISQLYKKNENLIHKVPFVFITLDPQRDTIDRLTEYVRFFHPQLDFIRFESQQIINMTADFGSRFTANRADQKGHYSVDHSAEIYLINSSGKIVNVFHHPTKYEDLIDELKKEGVL